MTGTRISHLNNPLPFPSGSEASLQQVETSEGVSCRSASLLSPLFSDYPFFKNWERVLVVREEMACHLEAVQEKVKVPVEVG